MNLSQSPFTTCRTHSSSRAYIAASRRSDRSLEARVESARRASEIHKRRTGRSLRVTEQDVVNEEMYEEEDDDLPMQYRRLTAHLQTGSADFNRRLSAYLTNHVAMRTALDQAITNSYAQQYPNAPQFAHNQSMYPSPFIHNTPQQHPSHSYGQPYPTPGTPGYRPNHQTRTSSHSHTQSTPTFSPHMPSPALTTPSTQRRPSQSSKSSSHSPHQQRSSEPQTPQSYDVKKEGSPTQMKAPPPPPPPPHQPQPPFQNMIGYPNMSPFSMTLPVESQMLLSGALDPNDPLAAAMMAGSENMPNPYNYGSHTYSKPRSFSHTFDGMSTTLAPSALDMQPRLDDYSQPPSTASIMPASAPATMLGFDSNDFSKASMFPSTHSSQGSGTVTPAGLDAGWDAFINDNSWGENVT